MSSRGHGPVDPGTESRHTNGDDKHARYGPLGDGEAGVQVTGECPMSYSGGAPGRGQSSFSCVRHAPESVWGGVSRSADPVRAGEHEQVAHSPRVVVGSAQVRVLPGALTHVSEFAWGRGRRAD